MHWLSRRETVVSDIGVSKAPCTFHRMSKSVDCGAATTSPSDASICTFCRTSRWARSFALIHISFIDPFSQISMHNRNIYVLFSSDATAQPTRYSWPYNETPWEIVCLKRLTLSLSVRHLFDEKCIL